MKTFTFIILSSLLLLLVLLPSCNKKKSISSVKSIEINRIKVDSISKPYIVINTYPSIKIRGQEWMTVNLDVKVFNNGDTISEASSKEEWRNALKNKLPAWSYTSNIEEQKTAMGRIYNYYAVSDMRGIAPKGWRIPSNRDWIKLLDESQSSHNLHSNYFWGHLSEGINQRGFNDINGGYRYENGQFYSLNKNSFYWTSDYRFTTNAIGKQLLFKYGSIIKVRDSKRLGFYIRCVK